MLYSQCNYRLVLFIIPSPISGFLLYISVLTSPLFAFTTLFLHLSLDRINSCPNNCSSHGKCTSGNSIASRVYCECDKYWKGEACDIPYCRNNCGSPDHGYCDLTGEKLCVCNDSWQGTTHFHFHFHSYCILQDAVKSETFPVLCFQQSIASRVGFVVMWVVSLWCWFLIVHLCITAASSLGFCHSVTKCQSAIKCDRALTSGCLEVNLMSFLTNFTLSFIWGETGNVNVHSNDHEKLPKLFRSSVHKWIMKKYNEMDVTYLGFPKLLVNWTP